MKLLLIAILPALFLAGCMASSTAAANRQSTEVVAFVRSYSELVPLGGKQRQPNIFSVTLEIVSPTEMRGALIEAISETPLKGDHPLRKTGSTLNLAIQNLEQHRGASSSGEGRAWHVLYSISISDIEKLTMKEDLNPTVGSTGTTNPPSTEDLIGQHVAKLGSALAAYSLAVRKGGDQVDASSDAVAEVLKDWKAIYLHLVKQRLEEDPSRNWQEIYRLRAGTRLTLELGAISEEYLARFQNEKAIRDDWLFTRELIDYANSIRY